MVVRRHLNEGIPWYEHEKSKLEIQIESCFKHNVGPKKIPDYSEKTSNPILGIVSPHAGFSCSGAHAAHGFLELSKIESLDTVIILGTNHTGLGPSISIFPKGVWETPLGSISIDEKLHEKLLDLSKEYKSELDIAIDEEAHINEHSIDNQIPFIQYIFKNKVQILPICIGIHSLNASIKLSEILSKLMAQTSKKIVVVSSSDFTHYLTADDAKRRDRPIINSLLKGDLEEAHLKQKTLRASICGFGPILVLFSLAKLMKFTQMKELIYGHSGETCGSNNQVVAYASILIEK